MDDASSVHTPGATDADRLVETTSDLFVGEWQRLVSTTNWEKGRIIQEWRQALIESGASVQVYSDEAWARRVGGVTSQHVGRLRRVHERFAATRAQYPALYWSHFQAALDWHDAELWLEGARLEGWSVADMRAQRFDAHGAVADREPLAPAEEAETYGDETAADASSAAESAPGDSSTATSHAEEDFMSGGHSTDGETTDSDDEVPWETAAVAPAGDHEGPTGVPVTGFSNLPDDLLEAFEGCKLAIVRHRLSGWSEVSPELVLGALDSLADLVRAPV
ncbi:MAG: hypothetical protein K1X74_01785 [Pirellulales bacterium]|nr:hypothetical protein [Pirellulales bacterium]